MSMMLSSVDNVDIIMLEILSRLKILFHNYMYEFQVVFTISSLKKHSTQ